MQRRTSSIAVLLSLITALLIATLWMRGLFVRDQLVTSIAGRKVLVGLFAHHVYVLAFPPSGFSASTEWQTGLRQYPSRPIYWELRYHHRPDGTLRVGLPFWLPLSFAAAAPMWWVVQRVERARRRHAGLCRTCGYDLRASRARCPECGTAIPSLGEEEVNHREHREGVLSLLPLCALCVLCGSTLS